MTASENIRQILEVGYNGSDEQTASLSIAFDLLEKQEKGLIAELPVPIGSTVYRIDMFTSITKCGKCRFYNHNESYDYSACNISYTDYCHANCYQIETIIDVSKNFIIYHWDEFGKTIFADMKEAGKQFEKLGVDGLRTCSSDDWEQRQAGDSKRNLFVPNKEKD